MIQLYIFHLRLFLIIITAGLQWQTANAQDCTWLGQHDSLWSNPLNWSCNKVPDANTSVYIFKGTPFIPNVVGQTTVKDLHVYAGSAIDYAFEYLQNAYQYLSGDAGYGRTLSLYFTVENDEMAGPAGTADNGRRDIARYTLTPENVELARPYNNLYTGVLKATQCIKLFPSMALYTSGTPEEQSALKKMYGEALVLKAQYYFELIRNWGDVPYSETLKDSGALFNSIELVFNGQTNRDSTYKIILNDLAIAANLLPWRTEAMAGLPGGENERITKGAAKALRARIALFAGGYSLRQDAVMRRPDNYVDYYRITQQECADLIQKRDEHTLTPSYKDLWKNTVCAHLVNNASGELIFQAAMDSSSPAFDSKLGYYNGPRVNQLGNASLNILPTYFYTFDSTDTRRDVTCAPYDVQADGITKSGLGAAVIRDGKFRRDWISNPVVAPDNLQQYFGLNWPLIRFADVLLMFAEADNEINGTAGSAAIAAYDEVRLRAYGSLPSVAPAEKGAFFNALVKERLLEFGGEGIRKYDLIRWNLLGQKIQEAKNNLNLMASFSAPYENLPVSMYYNTGSTADDSKLWNTSFYTPTPASAPPGTTRTNWINSTNLPGLNSRFATGYTAGKSELLPYPLSVTDLNPWINQNPNY
ncbi:MAG: RagB/SusD family nutrient uptake outer membrane protein [Ferruginibacter sp.]